MIFLGIEQPKAQEPPKAKEEQKVVEPVKVRPKHYKDLILLNLASMQRNPISVHVPTYHLPLKRVVLQIPEG